MNQELKNLLSTVFDLGKLAAVIVEKKGFDASEILPAEALFGEIPGAFSGASAALSQLKSLDAAGEADLVSFIVSKLGLADPKAASILSKGLVAAAADYEFIKALRA